ncbi:MAG TPA: response regulator [Gemmatimonadaceae bacterium]|nr:response regulator [Gemmatimonadaceae bacterium]
MPRGSFESAPRDSTDGASHAEELSALRLSEARLAGIVGSAMDAIISIDANQNVVLFNAAAETLFGVQESDAIGSPLGRFIPDRSRPQDVSPSAEPTTHPIGASGALTALRKDGTEFPIEATISQITVGGERLLTVILRDVTERQGLENQLRQAQKMEAVGQLAGGVAHDFNNLLMVMLGNIDLAEMDGTTDADRPKYLAEARDAANRGVALTRQLLTFSRRTTPHRSAVDLNTIVTRNEKLMRRALGEENTLLLQLSPDPCVVVSDTGEIEQILLNLVVNARDAMPRGGSVTIATTHVEFSAAERTRWPTLAPGSHVRLTVRDTGTGMSDETRRRLFEPFFTTKPPGQGTGLGLATIYGIVTESNGAIDVTTNELDGTEFIILLPASKLEARDSRPGKVGTAHRGGTILLVEDEPSVRATLRAALTRRGYIVLEAQHGRDALLVWESYREQIDLVLTDLRMPEMGGRALAAALRAERPHLPLLFMSGYDDNALPELEAAGAGEEVLQKPFATDDLFAKIASRLADR